MSGIEIANRALEMLYCSGKTESADKLRRHIGKDYIVLGLGDIDWDIELAIEQVGGYDCIYVGNNLIGKFYFNKEY